MGLISRALARETRGITATETLRRLVQSSITRAGVAVNEQNALQLMTVYTAVRILSEAFAQVPLKVYRRRADGSREEARDHPLYKILHDQPNEEMSSFTLRETMLGHLALWGNAYCEISRNFLGDIIGLWPLLPSRTRPIRTASGQLVYETRIQKDPANVALTQTIYLPARNVLHVPGFGFDGMKGMSVIGTVREGIGLAFAYENFGAFFFGNNTVPGLTLTTDLPMKKEQVDELERRIKQSHEGLTNSQRLMILTGGLKPTQIQMPLDDAQFIEQRKYTRSEIMALYRIPPHMTNDTEKVSSWGAGIEQMSIGFVVYTMMPYFQRFEQAINMKLLGANAQANLYPEFDPEGFLRGDYKTRMDGYAIARQWGWMSANDIKRKENEPTIGPQGDVYLQPLNYQGADKALAEPAVAPRGMPGTSVDVGVEAGGTPPTTDSSATRSVPAETRPIGPYPDWAACIADQLSKGHSQPSAEKICGALEAQTALPDRSATAHRHALADVTDRILRREQVDVSAGIKKILRRGGLAGIPAWLESFYAEHRNWAAKQAAPVFAGIAESLGVRDVGETQAATLAYVDRMCTESMEHIRRAMRGEGELDRILGAWERRAEKIAQREIGLATATLGGLAPLPESMKVLSPPIVLPPVVLQIPALGAELAGLAEATRDQLPAIREIMDRHEMRRQEEEDVNIKALADGFAALGQEVAGLAEAVRDQPPPVVNVAAPVINVPTPTVNIDAPPPAVINLTNPVNIEPGAVVVQPPPPLDVTLETDRSGKIKITRIPRDK